MYTFSLFEGLSIKAFAEWFAGRPVITAGPFDRPVVKAQVSAAQDSTEVGAFLDAVLEKYGDKSVVYVRV